MQGGSHCLSYRLEGANTTGGPWAMAAVKPQFEQSIATVLSSFQLGPGGKQQRMRARIPVGLEERVLPESPDVGGHHERVVRLETRGARKGETWKLLSDRQVTGDMPKAISGTRLYFRSK
jgi:hypothetical protein